MFLKQNLFQCQRLSESKKFISKFYNKITKSSEPEYIDVP